ncbi:MAG TPA: 2-C-methyl-D-erythritol 4-phosphate cytidylyltransferase [Steroidobacteraceae bacterium]|nr:2-C-methyl-D-erythritol 4-phosphate cytidylyltransferase [Steroidobacteraceae bacterium]
MRYWLVMPAAGSGRRFGDSKPKQYATLLGRTVIEWALAPFLEDTRCAGAVVVLAADDPHWPSISKRLPAVTVVVGGAERGHSVRNGLAALSRRAQADGWVLVHDAARPCLSTQERDHLLSQLAQHPVGGLLAARGADTLKRETAGETPPAVAETVDRTGLWRALTPQMFRYGRLCEALDRALSGGRIPTDESQAIEWLGERPVLVEGSAANIKITNTEDLALATALLQGRAAALAAGKPATRANRGEKT